MAKLYIIPGSKPAHTQKQRIRKKIKAITKPDDLLQCPRCGSRELIETRVGMVLRRGKPCGGTKIFLCADCGRRGERVVVA